MCKVIFVYWFPVVIQLKPNSRQTTRYTYETHIGLLLETTGPHMGTPLQISKVYYSSVMNEHSE